MTLFYPAVLFCGAGYFISVNTFLAFSFFGFKANDLLYALIPSSFLFNRNKHSPKLSKVLNAFGYNFVLRVNINSASFVLQPFHRQ